MYRVTCAIGVALFVSTVTLFFMGTAKAQPSVVSIGADSPTSCTSACDRVIVVFFHGLNGSAKSFLNENTQFYWPTELARDSMLIGRVGVFHVNYETSLLQSAPAIGRIEHDLDVGLDNLFSNHPQSRIIFVAHSLGGIVAQAYLNHVLDRYNHGALARFRYLYTFGTPYEGAQLSAVVHLLVQDNAQLRVLEPEITNDFSQLLNSSFVDIIAKHNGLRCTPLNMYAAFETVTMYGTIVVPRDSAAPNFTTPLAIQRNHIDLVRPADRSDIAYEWVRDGILSCLSNSPSCPAPTGQYAECAAMKPGLPPRTSRVEGPGSIHVLDSAFRYHHRMLQ